MVFGYGLSSLALRTQDNLSGKNPGHIHVQTHPQPPAVFFRLDLYILTFSSILLEWINKGLTLGVAYETQSVWHFLFLSVLALCSHCPPALVNCFVQFLVVASLTSALGPCMCSSLCLVFSHQPRLHYPSISIIVFSLQISLQLSFLQESLSRQRYLVISPLYTPIELCATNTYRPYHSWNIFYMSILFQVFLPN